MDSSLKNLEICCSNIHLYDVAKQHEWCSVHMYSGPWHVDFSFLSQNVDGRKEECNLCVFLDEEVYDPLYYSKGSVNDLTLPCDILQAICCISLKEVRLHGIAQASLSSKCQMDFQSSS